MVTHKFCFERLVNFLKRLATLFRFCSSLRLNEILYMRFHVFRSTCHRALLSAMRLNTEI